VKRQKQFKQLKKGDTFYQGINEYKKIDSATCKDIWSGQHWPMDKNTTVTILD